MHHVRTTNPETVRICKFFLKGKCDFPDNICWFIHSKSSPNLSPQMVEQYKCGFCDDIFKSKSDFMNHRKQKHEKSVPACRDNVNGTCSRHGTNTCWFRHEDFDHDNHENESSDMTKHLFEMMEKFTDRMGKMESQLYKQTE